MQSQRVAALVVVVALGYAAPSSALPSINVVKTSSSKGRLDVITTDPGVLGAEISIVLSNNARFTSVTINSAIFSAEKPGDNPFLQGSPEGGDTTGLWLSDSRRLLFASYESQYVETGLYQLLQFEFEYVSQPMCVNPYADGFVSVNGETTNVPGDNGGGVVCEFPTGDTNGDGITNLTDLNNVRNNFGSPSPPNLGDTDGDGDIDLTDLNNVKNNFGPSPSVAVPEPSSLTIAALSAMAWSSSRRRRR